MKPDGQGDHTKNEAGHDEILGASHGSAIAEVRNQHLTWECDKKSNRGNQPLRTTKQRLHRWRQDASNPAPTDWEQCFP